MKRCMATLMLFAALFTTYAQQSVTGTVMDANGPLPGVTVTVTGTSRAAQTDANGYYSINASQGDVLRFSTIGYAPQEVTVGAQQQINVTLELETGELEEVVVTAMGIQRERRSLGYAVQEVKGAVLSDAKESNVTNALSGKIAGLQVARSSNGAGSSAKIILRGFTSLTGDNQPLIVVDGVPINNFTGAGNQSADFWNPGYDMGNGLGDINPEDIESVTVLKGPSAAALYGVRAGNGVIQIVTKSGRAQPGIGLTLSSTIGVENNFMIPETQNAYGQGWDGLFDRDDRLSWGPKAEGQTVTKWDGTSEPLTIHDNIGNFLRTGINQNHSAAFQQQYGNTSIYTSVNRLDQSSILPGNKMSRTNLTARATTKFGRDDRWSTDTKVQVNNTQGYNRPINSRDWSSMYSLYMLPRSLNILDFKGDNMVNEDGDMQWYGSGVRAPINPYWRAEYDRYKDSRDRVMLSGTLNYKFNDWLNAEVRAGGDLFTTSVERRVNVGAPSPQGGHYSQSKQTFNETNYSALLSARQDNLFGKWGGSATLGGQLMSQRSSTLSGSVTDLEVPNFFSLNNGKGNPTISESLFEKKINSVFGTVGLNYDNFLYLDATFRNDWTSTLHPDNRSFFYPSATLSFIPTDMIRANGGSLPSWMDYVKLRASFAEVGNDMNPYQLYNVYSIGNDPLGNTTANTGEIFFDHTVVNELIRNFEAGTEIRLFNNRLNFDFGWYKKNATNQLINLPLDPSSGYAYRKINTGNIQNEGIEMMLNFRAIERPSSFFWTVSANFSRNIDRIIDIAQHLDVTSYDIGVYDDLSVRAANGGLYGEIWGHKFLRVKDATSPHYGELVLDALGLPQRDTEKVLLGDQQPRAQVGLINSFGYKGLSFSFQVDGRFGGQIFSSTQVAMQQNGTAAVTAPNGERGTVTLNGVVSDGSGGYTPTTSEVTTQDYWWRVSTANNLGINEANVYDATNVRLRNVQLTYQLPRTFLGNSVVQNARVFASCNNVWMIHSNMRGIDPESTFATGSNALGFESGAPATMRSFFFGVTLGF